MTPSFIFYMDIIGTVAFAISGVMVAVRKDMDAFGIIILALVTATGGGVLRDILIGQIPPVMFRNPVYVIISVVTACVAFLILYFNKGISKKNIASITDKLLFWFDTLGLAAFTVDGVSAGMQTGSSRSLFLVVFLGTITGVGGGIIRDILATEMPYIFVRHIYAIASIIGALLTGILWPVAGQNHAILAGFLVTILIRALAAHYKWNLPHIRKH
ncbi:MAG: TRIC cation channel family protein [Butyrivibrio sp.]|jgi:uncharacterized membrane protein YeiH|nr:TRIC cation channel family protein [Butyrivibrio sp.]